MNLRKKKMSLMILDTISLGQSIAVQSPLSKPNLNSHLTIASSSTLLHEQTHTEEQSQISQSEPIQHIEPAVKSMKFREKRGTRIKELIKNKSQNHLYSHHYSQYFGPFHLLEQNSSQDQDYSINTEGLDSFDSDFGDDVNWKTQKSNSTHHSPELNVQQQQKPSSEQRIENKSKGQIIQSPTKKSRKQKDPKDVDEKINQSRIKKITSIKVETEKTQHKVNEKQRNNKTNKQDQRSKDEVKKVSKKQQKMRKKQTKREEKPKAKKTQK